MQPHRAFEERPSFDRLWGLLPQGKKGGAPGADFSFASSEFKTLGAFFCNFATLSFLGRQPGVAHGQPCAPVPDLVGSRFPSPYHFRARIQSFQAVAAPFPGNSVLPSATKHETPRFKRSTIGSTISAGVATRE